MGFKLAIAALSAQRGNNNRPLEGGRGGSVLFDKPFVYVPCISISEGIGRWVDVAILLIQRPCEDYTMTRSI